VLGAPVEAGFGFTCRIVFLTWRTCARFFPMPPLEVYRRAPAGRAELVPLLPELG